ncbi:MAG: hypothetical protein IRZ03_12595, partial [Acidobacterium ailaaui]|nr:hypothetical protein [Pseudacidobacterium ailaaui]
MKSIFQKLNKLTVLCLWITWISSPAVASDYAAVNSPQPFFNVREYGAKADGQTNDALAINKAIQAA